MELGKITNLFIYIQGEAGQVLQANKTQCPKNRSTLTDCCIDKSTMVYPTMMSKMTLELLLKVTPVLTFAVCILQHRCNKHQTTIAAVTAKTMTRC